MIVENGLAVTVSRNATLRQGCCLIVFFFKALPPYPARWLIPSSEAPSGRTGSVSAADGLFRRLPAEMPIPVPPQQNSVGGLSRYPHAHENLMLGTRRGNMREPDQPRSAQTCVVSITTLSSLPFRFFSFVIVPSLELISILTRERGEDGD